MNYPRQYRFFEREKSLQRKSRCFSPHNFHARHLVAFLLLWICLPAIVSAQQVTLNDILEQGKQNFPFLKAKNAEISSAESKLKSVKTDYLPSFIVQDQYTFSTDNNVAGAFLPNEGTALSPSGGIRPNNIYTGVFGSFATAMVDWKVFNFGKIKANINAVNSDIARSKFDYENELFQHQVKIIDAYLVLLINQKLVEAQVQNLERARVFKEVTDANVTSGMRPGVDSSLASAEYAKAQLLLLESRRSEKTQQLRLAELSGELKENLTVDSLHFYSKLPISATFSGELQKNPLLRLAQSQIDLSNARSTAIHRSALPSVSLVAAGWGRGSGVSNQDDSYNSSFGSGVKFQAYNYLFGISTKWNLTNILKVRNEYKSEQFQAERFKEIYNTQKLQLSRQQRESEIQFDLSLAQARLTPIQLSAAQTAFNQAEARYRNGMTDLFTLAQSVNTLNRAEIDRYVTNGNAWRALLMEAASEGYLTIFLNQTGN